MGFWGEITLERDYICFVQLKEAGVGVRLEAVEAMNSI